MRKHFLLTLILLSGFMLSHQPVMAAWNIFRPSLDVSNLNGVWGMSENHLFAYGAKGAILFFDGTVWSKMNTPAKNRLNDMWGDADDNVFAVGDSGTILHYDGTEWHKQDSGTKLDLYGIDGRNGVVHATGEFSTLLKYDGTVWSTLISTERGNRSLKMIGSLIPALKYPLSTIGILACYDVTTTTHNNLLVSGTASTILKFSENDVDRHEISVCNARYNFLHLSPDDIYAYGRHNLFDYCEKVNIFNYNGSTWTKQKSDMLGQVLDMTATQSGNLYGVGTGIGLLRQKNNVWTASPMDINFRQINSRKGPIRHYGNKTEYTGIWAESDNNIFVTTRYGSIFHYNGSTWSLQIYNGPETSHCNHPIMHSRGKRSTVVATQKGLISRYTDGRWSVSYSINDGISGISVTENDVIFANNANQIFMLNGEKIYTLPPPPLEKILSVWTAGENLFVGGNIKHRLKSNNPLRKYDIKYEAALYSFEDGVWSQFTEVPHGTLRKVIKAGQGLHYAVIAQEGIDTLHRLDGNKWKKLDIQQTGWRIHPTATIDDNFYIILQDNVKSKIKLTRLDGDGVDILIDAPSLNIKTICRTQSGEFFAGGERRDDKKGAVLHYTGQRWEEADIPESSAVLELWETNDGRLFGATSDGAVLFQN